MGSSVHGRNQGYFSPTVEVCNRDEKSIGKVQQTRCGDTAKHSFAVPLVVATNGATLRIGANASALFLLIFIASFSFTKVRCLRERPLEWPAEHEGEWLQLAEPGPTSNWRS